MKYKEIIWKNFVFDLKHNWFVKFYKYHPRVVFRWRDMFHPFVVLFRLVFQQETYKTWLEQHEEWRLREERIKREMPARMKWLENEMKKYEKA